jgi:CheY-like chemotaxis protein
MGGIALSVTVMTASILPARPLRIFVVEDHADTLKYLRMFLESCGHAVRSASSVEEATAKLPGAEADVLISDLGLPDGTGWELMRMLPADAPIYAVAMSGFGSKGEREKSRAAGFRRHLVKPFDLDDLVDALAEAAAEMGTDVESQ